MEYEHQCQAKECAHEWTAEYSIKEDPPKVCPKCGLETAMRVISMKNKGTVLLTGQDLVDSVRAGAKRLQRDATRNENTYANLLGEGRYQNLQTKMDRRGK